MTKTKKIVPVLIALLIAFVLVPAVYAEQEDEPKQMYGGTYVGATPNGVALSVLYDSSEQVTLAGELGLNNAVITGRALYRFPMRATEGDFIFQPYAGGGLVSFYGSANGLGIVGSGGAFVSIKNAPKWRFSGEINWVSSNIDIVPVNGLGVRLGAHYSF